MASKVSSSLMICSKTPMAEITFLSVVLMASVILSASICLRISSPAISFAKRTWDDEISIPVASTPNFFKAPTKYPDPAPSSSTLKSDGVKPSSLRASSRN